jgi:hypothetical protein
MNSHRCCHHAPASTEAPARWSPLRHLGRTAQWLVPGAIYLAMPKCPACVAAYVALITGAGISLSAAAQLRIWALGLCVAALTFVAARRARSAVAWAASRK